MSQPKQTPGPHDSQGLTGGLSGIQGDLGGKAGGVQVSRCSSLHGTTLFSDGDDEEGHGDL